MGAGTTVAFEVLFGLLDRAQAIGALLAQAKSENRDITQAELDALVTADDIARTAQVAAIERRRASEKG